MNKNPAVLPTVSFLFRMLVILKLLYSCTSSPGSFYYVSPEGDDGNDGTYRRPWKTIEKVNLLGLNPGDRILFRGGETFSGSLVFENDSGLSGKPIIISTYGSGKATIDGGTGSGIKVKKCSFMIIDGLKIKGSGRKTNQNGNGVEVANSAFISVCNMETYDFQNAGIWITGCDSITVKGVYSHSNGFSGIATGHNETTSRIVIQNCLAENNPGNPMIMDNHSGNGILLASVKCGLVEYCEASYNGWDMPRLGNGPVGIWTWNSDSVVIQHCLSHHNKSPDYDGGGFDLDGGVTNSIVQYNFSHHNSGAGFLVCQFEGAPRELARNQICFNISLDDGLDCHNAGIMIYAGGDNFKDALFYNNTIINTFHSAVNMDGNPVYLKKPPMVCFYNNLFISGKEQIRNLNLMPGTILQGNLYWAFGDGGFSVGHFTSFKEWVKNTPYEKSEDKITGLYTDPVIEMNFHHLPDNPAELSRFSAFYPLPGSSLLVNGVQILGKHGIPRVKKDFRQNPLEAGDKLIGAMK
jgi:Right handed beta helix region